MVANNKAARHRQWAANAIVMAAQMTGEADRETLLLIARQHLEKAEKAERSRARSLSRQGTRLSGRWLRQSLHTSDGEARCEGGPNPAR
jgi:hypothetical protein